VAGHHNRGLRGADAPIGDLGRDGRHPGGLVDGAKGGGEWRGRVDHALVELQPLRMVEADGGGEALMALGG
jgi:hypothetical protein